MVMDPPERLIDAQIAEMMGWRWVTTQPLWAIGTEGGHWVRYSFLEDPERAASSVEFGWEYGKNEERAWVGENVPRFSTEWDAAGQLMEWVKDHGEWVEVGYNVALEEWKATVSADGGYVHDGGGRSGPEALCKAFLKAHGREIAPQADAAGRKD